MQKSKRGTVWEKQIAGEGADVEGSGLYRKPFIVSYVFFAASALMIGGGAVLAETTGEMGYFALVAFGVLALIIAGVVFLMYRRLEAEFNRTLRGKLVLRFIVDNRLLEENVERSVRELKNDHKAKLLITLFFCGLFAIVLPFFFEDGYLFIFICLGLAVFLSLSAFIITSYRVRKLRRGSSEFILSPNGVYAGGEFHSWSTPGTRLTMFSSIKKILLYCLCGSEQNYSTSYRNIQLTADYIQIKRIFVLEKHIATPNCGYCTRNY
jgi:uncharacterized membrane protein HdeD (DUF308 family)